MLGFGKNSRSAACSKPAGRWCISALFAVLWRDRIRN